MSCVLVNKNKDHFSLCNSSTYLFLSLFVGGGRGLISYQIFFLIFVSYLTSWGEGGSSGLWNYTLASCLGWVGGSALGSEQHRLVILMIQIL